MKVYAVRVIFCKNHYVDGINLYTKLEDAQTRAEALVKYYSALRGENCINEIRTDKKARFGDSNFDAQWWYLYHNTDAYFQARAEGRPAMADDHQRIYQIRMERMELN